MEKVIKSYECEICGQIHIDKKTAKNCCSCEACKKYIGRWDKKDNYIHCFAGYTCDSFSSKGDKGTHSKFEKDE